MGVIWFVRLKSHLRFGWFTNTACLWICFPPRSVITYKHNVSVNNTILYIIYNENSILSGRHVSTFIRSSSDPLRKQIQELSVFHCIVRSKMHWNVDSSWICFPRGSEDDPIKVETCRPDNTLFSFYITQSVVLLTDTLCLYFYAYLWPFTNFLSVNVLWQ